MWLWALLPAVLGPRPSVTLSGPFSWRLPGSSSRFDRPGDVVVGGSFSILCFDEVTLFNFTAPPVGRASSDLSLWSYLVAQSFVFAVEEINRSVHLLPNLTLGFSIRNSGCSVHGAVFEMMSFLTGQEEPIPNYACGPRLPRVAVVGDTRSALSMAMARLLGLYKFPQISHSSTLPILSDKAQFPSFLRTLASDLTSCYAVTQLVVRLGWTWVDILAQDDDYGQQASSLAARELSQAGICIEAHLYVPAQQSLEDTDAIVQRMQVCTATVVLVFLNNSSFLLILQGLLGLPVSGQVWVSSESLHMAIALSMPGASEVLQGGFSLIFQSSHVPGFPEFLAHLHPSRTPEDMFIERFWEVNFGCTWPPKNGSVASGVQLCSGNERLQSTEDPFWEARKMDIAYTPVYSIAHALQDLLGCEHWAGARADPGHVLPWQLLQPLRKVRFKTPDDTEVTFDANGDLVSKFDIVRGQKTPEGSFHLVHVGQIDPRGSSGSSMTVHLQENLQVPSSVCSRSCVPGFSQTPRQGAPHCCFECSPCPEGHFAEHTDVPRCLPCPEEQYPSPARDRCLPRTEAFLAFEEPLGLALAAAAVCLAGLALLVLGLFLRHRDSPVVRANNRALSHTLLASLALCALCPLLFLGRPTAVACLLRQTTFAVLFTVAVSCVLAKTLTVALAFRVTRPGSRARACLGPRASSSLVLVASLTQVALCGLWLGTSPPFPDRDVRSEPRLVVLRCQEGSGLAFSCVLGYLGLLAGATFSVAFLARGLPAAFNETRLLTFGMLLFCSVWLAFLPLYHSARGKSTVAVEVFSILASTAGLLGGIFLPKCYIILLRPEQSTPAWLRPGWGRSGTGRAPGPRRRASRRPAPGRPGQRTPGPGVPGSALL
ncbi:vomeronasal type-2 receptor 26-like [Sciurus carolinensis]|uniref:vomeronasal type-2 receptor 26-like n=1 Tax=Sciurus carolinensis TaxID=30640 RepID=UPI001FB21A18|nr:vomeronasal type-2 receptor 26-like [Sciurus carolinensis]